MIRALVGILQAGLFLTVPGVAAAAAGPTVPQDVRDAVRDHVENGLCTGMIVGAVDTNGSSYFGLGRLALKNDCSIDENTLFEIGSITKVFTCLLLADFIERRLVELDEPIERYLPATVRVPERNERKITLRDLATHRSGLPRLPSNLEPKDTANPYADYSQDQLYDFLSHHTLQRDIGSTYEYSNLGVGLLGHILARKSGRPYEELVIKRICTPLQMNDTRITLSPEQRSRLARGHAGEQEVANWDFDCLAGCGALRSTARDMLRFLAANMGIDQTELYPIMQSLYQQRLATGMPGLRVALGWHIWQAWTKPGKEVIWHNGGTGGYHSFCGFVPARKTAVVVLSNSTDDIDDIGLHMLDPRYDLKDVRKAKMVPVRILEQYVGTYELQPGANFHVTRNGDALYVQLTGQKSYPVYPESETKFFYKMVDAQITFVKDNSGKVTGLILHQNGLNQTAKKTR